MAFFFGPSSIAVDGSALSLAGIGNGGLLGWMLVSCSTSLGGLLLIGVALHCGDDTPA